MTAEEIERLAALCARAGIGEIELTHADFTLHLHLEAVAAEATHEVVAAPEAQAAFKGVRAPGVGVFRINHPTTGRPVAEPGQAVRQGDVVGVVQVGAILKPVVAPSDGVLGAALVEDGMVVGYGAPLYALA